MREILARIVEGEDLTEIEASSLLEAMTEDGLDPVVAGATLAALRSKGETATEVRAFAVGLRDLAVRPDIDSDVAAVDVVGTGGDDSGSLNLSTGSALLAAAAGVPVIKHGNRSISSKSGSADVLEALGMQIPLDSEAAGVMFERSGFSFLFAPAYHPAMKTIGPVRRSLGIRTIFNIAGPLANPAAPPFHVIGAYSLEMARIMADTVSAMPIVRTFVIHGEPGWDEPTPIGPYHLFDVTPGSVIDSIEDPAEFGFARCSAGDLAGSDADSNADAIRQVFSGTAGPHRDALVLGASLALRVTGVETTDALARCATAIDSGKASMILDQIAANV
ncbi:MAG: anthranilate phosphoribosyltransferase [Acidimicrobiia bacterium]